MEKRIFLAIVISLGVLLGWGMIAPRLFPELAKKPPVATKPAAQTPAAGTTSTSGSLATTTDTVAPAPDQKPVQEAEVAAVPVTPVAAERAQTAVVDADQFRAVFSNRGAQLISYTLKNYQEKKRKAPVDLVKVRDAGRIDYPFMIVTGDAALNARLNRALYAVSEREERGKRVLEYRFSDGRVAVTKAFRFAKNEPFLFDFSVAITPPTPYRIHIGPGIRTLAPEEKDTSVVMNGNGVVQRAGKFSVIAREKADALEIHPGIDYIGIEDNYFLAAIRPTQGGEGTLQSVVFFEGDAKNKKARPEFYAGVNATSSGTVEGQAFFGPKETKLLDGYGFEGALQFGWFGIIARFFLEALVWINNYTHNYGWAIVVLTILIKIVLYPLQHKSIVSMKKMQKVQPKMEAIKARYKKAKTDADQRQKMNVEMMQLYQKEGINPMAGCLPLVIQLPILWGFYNLLSRAIELRNAPWALWIHDLSDKDPTYVLPILMTATMFIQTYITPSTGDPMQRRIFLIMPLMFGFMFKDFPSGLVLYWLVQNVLTIIQQTIMNKWWKTHPDEIQNA